MKYLDYNEKRQHGDPDFPIKLYYTNEHSDRYLMDPHWHKELEIIRILSGEFDIYINNNHHLLKSGDIAFINCKFLHHGTPKNCEYQCILCDISMMARKNHKIFTSYISPIINCESIITGVFSPDNSVLYNTVLNLFTTLEAHNDYYELSTLTSLFLIFELLYRNKIIEKIVTPKVLTQANTIAQIIHWIDLNFTEHITLEILAKKAGMTPNHLCKIFKEYTGKTPTQYINSVRIDNACAEMKQTDKSITQIALENGFNDISYFCKVFKKHKGISAKKYS